MLLRSSLNAQNEWRRGVACAVQADCRAWLLGWPWLAPLAATASPVGTRWTTIARPRVVGLARKGRTRRRSMSPAPRTMARHAVSGLVKATGRSGIFPMATKPWCAPSTWRAMRRSRLSGGRTAEPVLARSAWQGLRCSSFPNGAERTEVHAHIGIRMEAARHDRGV